MLSKIINLLKTKQVEEEANAEQQRFLAAVTLLIEVAKADHALSEDEEKALVEIVNTHFADAALEREELLTLAKEKSTQATSLYEFTSVINEHYTAEQKFELIVLMWKVAQSDAIIDAYEEHLIRRVSDLIYVPHMKFIEAKHLAQH